MLEGTEKEVKDQELRKAIGARLQEARETIPRLSREAVAEACGVSRTTIYNWEKGFYFPSPERIQILIRLYGVTANWMLGTVDDDKEQAETLLGFFHQLSKENRDSVIVLARGLHGLVADLDESEGEPEEG